MSKRALDSFTTGKTQSQINIGKLFDFIPNYLFGTIGPIRDCLTSRIRICLKTRSRFFGVSEKSQVSKCQVDFLLRGRISKLKLRLVSMVHGVPIRDCLTNRIRICLKRTGRLNGVSGSWSLRTQPHFFYFCYMVVVFGRSFSCAGGRALPGPPLSFCSILSMPPLKPLGLCAP